MNRWIVAVVLFVCWSDAAAASAIACRSAPGTDDYYQYRLIDGKRCWFRGHSKLEKSALYWRKSESRANVGDEATGHGKAPDVEPASRPAAGRSVAATEVVGRDSPERRAPDFDAVFAHFPAYEVARPVVHLLYPKNVAQSWGSKRVAVVLYRREP